MKKYFYDSLFGLFIYLVAWQHVNAILDGRSAPIYLDTLYTFSDYEWARGSVYFRKGFDLPLNGTVFLGIDGGFVDENIHLNGGTLCLESDLHLINEGDFVERGFIDANGHRITYQKKTKGLFTDGGYIRFLSPIQFFGTQSSRFDPRYLGSCTLDFSAVNGEVVFQEGNIILRRNRYITTSTSPTAITFFSSNVAVNLQSLTLECPLISFNGNCSLNCSKWSSV